MKSQPEQNKRRMPIRLEGLNRVMKLGRDGPAPRFEIEPGMELEVVFWHFFLKFQRLPEPRSIAEAGISSHEVEGLGRWFAQQFGKPKNWCDRTWQERVEGDVTASSREMFGALFLIFASEICRDTCDEESAWPAISAAFKKNERTHSVLFVNGHPTEDCKAAIAAGAERLGLRSLIDRAGRQEYFDTLKLQIGFTLKGVTQRLPEWLRGISQPLAVKILLGVEPEFGGLQSGEFRRLWKVLQEYRRGLTSAAYATSVMASSPWIRPSWNLELLRAAKERYGGAAEESISLDEATRNVGAICEPMLFWPRPGRPELFLRFDGARVVDALGDADNARVTIDGQVVDRWAKQDGGSWRAGLDKLPCQGARSAKPNLRPRLLSISTVDAPIKEIDLLAELELGEPVLVFDTATGYRVTKPSLDPNREYLILCDPDMEVPKALSWRGQDRSVFLLTPPLNPDSEVLCDGDPYWRPQIGGAAPKRSFNLRLECPEGQIVEIGAAARLVVSGIPGDVLEADLVMGKTIHPLVFDGGIWRTQVPVEVSPKLALGDELVRVRICGPDFRRRVAARMALSLRGIAVIEPDDEGDEIRWNLLKLDRPMNRAGGSAKARVFAGARAAALYEGPSLVSRRVSRDLDLRDLLGWGDPLLAQPDSGPALPLVGSIEDRGCIDSSFGLGTTLLFRLRMPILPGAEHCVWFWPDLDAEPSQAGAREIRSEDEGFRWKIPKPDRMGVAAVAYKGVCLGAYWNIGAVSPSLLRPPTAKRFALLRWLKVPVLDSRLRSDFTRAALKAPVEFVRGWLGEHGPRCGWAHRLGDQGLEGVVRTVLWNYAERDETRLWKLVRAFPRDASGLAEALMHVSNISPSLAYNLASASVRGTSRHASLECIQRIVKSLVERSSIATLVRDCADLVGAREGELAKAVQSYGNYLDSRTGPMPESSDLRRLGERERGRRYLAAALLSRLLERRPSLR